MKARRMVARTLIPAALLLALAYEGFSYTRRTHQASAGTAKSAADTRDAVGFPWVGAGAIVIGGVMLFLRPRG